MSLSGKLYDMTKDLSDAETEAEELEASLEKAEERIKELEALVAERDESIKDLEERLEYEQYGFQGKAPQDNG